MTIVIGMRVDAGVVLASDSQVTQGSVRTSEQKLFRAPAGVIWGTSGDYGAAQQLYTEMRTVDLPQHPDREAARNEIRSLVMAAARSAGGEGASDLGQRLEGLFAWFGSDHVPHLMYCNGNGRVRFSSESYAIGGTNRFAEFGVFALRRYEFLDYPRLPLETAKMLAYRVADDVISFSAQGVGEPIQLAAVDQTSAAVLSAEERRPIADTADAFLDHQRDYLAPREEAATEGPEEDTGVRPE